MALRRANLSDRKIKKVVAAIDNNGDGKVRSRVAPPRPPAIPGSVRVGRRHAAFLRFAPPLRRASRPPADAHSRGVLLVVREREREHAQTARKSVQGRRHGVLLGCWMVTGLCRLPVCVVCACVPARRRSASTSSAA